jgi:hypothetical protein
MSIVSDKYDISMHISNTSIWKCVLKMVNIILTGWKRIKFKSSIMLNPNL